MNTVESTCHQYKRKGVIPIITMYEFGKRVGLLMEEQNLDPFELSLRSGIREATIRRWLKGQGKRLPDAEHIRKVAHVLDITVDALLVPPAVPALERA